MLLVPALLAGLATTACDDFASPAALTKPTILAVVAEPPLVQPGAQATLTTVVVDADGVLAGLATRHALIETYPGTAPMGRLEDDPTGARYIAPDPVPAQPSGAPPLDSVRIEVDTPIGTLTAVKVMAVLPVTASNPTVAQLTIGGTDALTQTITMTRGASVMIEVASEPPATEDTRYAWYSSAGEIEYFQSTPTELVAGDEAGARMLYVVIRDGQGGVAWRAVPIQVE